MALLPTVVRVAAKRAALSRAALSRAQSSAAGAAGASNAGKKPTNTKKEKESSDGGELYDPYKQYQEATGSRGYREFNPDLYHGASLDFTWEEPEQLMADKSWPATTGSDLFADLVNVSGTAPTGEKLDRILAEAFQRMGHKGINAIELPDLSVKIDEAHPDRDALELMKLSLLNNGRIKMDDKNEIMKSIIDELDHVRKDKTQLFKGLE